MHQTNHEIHEPSIIVYLKTFLYYDSVPRKYEAVEKIKLKKSTKEMKSFFGEWAIQI